MKSIIKGALCAVLTALILCSCSPSEIRADTSSFEAMDTVMSLKVYGGGDGICGSLQEEIQRLDSLLDATDEDSEIYRLNTDGSAALGEDSARLLTESLALCGRSEGRFDITVYPAVLAWGFTTGEYRVPDSAELEALSERIDYRSVSLSGDTAELPEGVMLDMGAVAKGYAADKCAELLRESSADAAILNLGGTICLYGEKPDGSRFNVGIADPDEPASCFGYLSLSDCSVATSGGYERYFERDGKRYIHILDPDTAAPADNGILSVTIISDSGVEADAMSTALFVMGTDGAVELYKKGGFDFIILTDKGELYITGGVADSFTLAEGYDFNINTIK